MSLESYLKSFRVEDPSGHRQYPNIEKLKEKLLGCHRLRLNGVEAFIDRSVIMESLMKCSLPSKSKRKFRSLFSKYFGNTRFDGDLRALLQTLLSAGCSYRQILGVSFGSLGGFHYTENWTRTKHCFGLVDAVHMSMVNLDVSVCFPRPVFQRAREKRREDSSKGQNVLLSLGMIPTEESLNDPVCRSVYVKGRRGFILHRQKTHNFPFRLLIYYLDEFPVFDKESDYVRLIKNSLVHAFCVQAEQDPPDYENPLRLFPGSVQDRLDRRFAKCRKRRVRFYKNLLESKSLCAEVSDSMVEEEYRSHYSSLCRDPKDVLPVCKKTLDELRDYGRRVGEFVAKVYNPFSTTLPNRRATIELSRSKGGAREALKGRLDISRGPLYTNIVENVSRIEPFVVGLFGPPGSGKSTTVQHLVRNLHRTLFTGVPMEDLVYSRSCATKHWDGYRGQPIVVLDDLGQNLSDRSDLVEFEQLVSSNRYVVPMASLDEKGREFSSPIILSTSNMGYAQFLRDSASCRVVEDEVAFWRRFHAPYLVWKEAGQKRPSFFRYRLSVSAAGEDVCPVSGVVKSHFSTNQALSTADSSWFKKHRSLSSALQSATPRPDDPLHIIRRANQKHRSEVPLDYPEVLDAIVESFHIHVDFHRSHLSTDWRQNVFCSSVYVTQEEPPFYTAHAVRKEVPLSESDVSASLVFPAMPPGHSPVVQAIAIKEPLKVRMITKAEADTKVLKPLQIALFEYLKTQPQFVLTHGMSWGDYESFDDKLRWMERLEAQIRAIRSRSSPGDLWLSGDYKAATDNFPMSVTEALLEGILESIDHEPTKAWARYETSSHVIRYPTGDVGQQTSGQLMGSLLSFPLLCFLNDYVVSRSGFKKGKYLINGDDVVALGGDREISTWRKLSPTVGLDLSIGKNFIDPEFCCINSQLFWNGDIQHTGKVSLQTRYGKTLSRCYSEMQYYYGIRDDLEREFIRRNLSVLRQSPRSLGVPTTHGGLGLSFVKTETIDHRLAKEVYLYDYLSPLLSVKRVPGFDFLCAVQVPVDFIYGTGHIEESLLGNESERLLNQLLSLDIDPVDSEDSELSFNRLQGFRNLMSDVEDFSTLFGELTSFSIRDFPPLGTLRTRLVFVQEGKRSFIKRRSVLLGLILLLKTLRHNGVVPPEFIPEVWIKDWILDPSVLSMWDQLERTPPLLELDGLSTIVEECAHPSLHEYVRDEEGNLLPSVSQIQNSASLPKRDWTESYLRSLERMAESLSSSLEEGTVPLDSAEWDIL